MQPTTSTDLPLTAVSIRPGVSILSVLRHLNYRSWFAIAEFVDNAIQSAASNHDALVAADGVDYRLRVDIEVDANAGRIVIRDNAAGIAYQDYQRSFRAAAVPPDRSGLSEFGMGMKSAACWFSNRWHVRTTALGEDVQRIVRFDISKIVSDSLEELTISDRPVPRSHHYTEIVLYDLNQVVRGRTLAKIKEHLASIYRVFLRNEALTLAFNGEVLSYSDPAILCAPYYRTPDGESVVWRKDIDFDLGHDLKVHGFAGIRATANTSTAGFALFRRNRLIEGSVDDTYRPEQIFGKSNSYRYQRVFGELHLSGFAVSHTKDGFQWDDQEDAFLDLLREHLNSDGLPILSQAEEYRVRPKSIDLAAGADRAANRTAETIERETPAVLAPQLGDNQPDATPPNFLPDVPLITHRVVELGLDGERWMVKIELTTDPAIGDWLSMSEMSTQLNSIMDREIHFRLSLVHPFMERFVGSDESKIEIALRFAAGLALAETAARQSGIRQAGGVRRNLNYLLQDALSKP